MGWEGGGVGREVLEEGVRHVVMGYRVVQESWSRGGGGSAVGGSDVKVMGGS